MIYQKINYNVEFFEPIRQKYTRLNRKIKINNYIKKLNKRPVEFQKMVFKEGLILTAVIFLMFILATKAVFFTAVASGSMYPAFNRDDLVLMQNVEHTYKPGDIIMFKAPDTSKPYTHRIVLVNDEGIRTKGDATDQADWWTLKKEDILGKAILIQGKPVVIKGYGRFFIVDDKNRDFGPFGQDYRKYFLFFEVVKIYGYVIAAASLFLYVVLTARQKSWQSR